MLRHTEFRSPLSCHHGNLLHVLEGEMAYIETGMVRDE